MALDAKELTLFLEKITETVLKAGEFAVASQEGVQNVGKYSDDVEEDTFLVKERRMAKTEVDEAVQEKLLKTIISMGFTSKFTLDAEEDTPSLREFKKESSTILVLDPIDGTLEYIKGNDKYTVCLAVVEKGVMRAALVYFPSRKHLYSLQADGKSYKTTYTDNLKVEEKKELKVPSDSKSKIVYCNNRVPQNIVDKLEADGFTVLNDKKGDVTWPDTFVYCMEGKHKAGFFHTGETRDMMLGAILGNTENGYTVDLSGNKLIWPNGGKVPFAIFGTGEKLL